MAESEFVIGRSWHSSPQTWKNFCRSLPTHKLLRMSTQPCRQSRKAHDACIRNTLTQFDAEYLRASNRHPARIRFNTQEGRLAWELTYA